MLVSAAVDARWPRGDPIDWSVMLLQIVTAFFLSAGCGQAVANRPANVTSLVSSRIEDRLLKKFDFNEEPLGNYEPMPMNWQQVTGAGYPRYLEPVFDKELGHDAPPSFKLGLAGGSLACRYAASEISVHPECEYLITAWIRPRGLAHARAFVTAFYLDHAMQEISNSRRRSAEVRGAGRDEPWTRVAIELPSGFANARWIGLSVHVEQAEPPVAGPAQPRPIHREDVHATAWFDDITVLRFPRVSLRFTAPGNVFPPETPVLCEVLVGDLDGRGLESRLEVFDEEGLPIDSRSVATRPVGGPAHAFDLGPLLPGYYEARLTVDADGHEAITHRQSFVRLAALPAPIGGGGGFGIALNASALQNRHVTQRLVELAAPSAVKLPLWRGPMSDAAIVEGDKSGDQLVRALRERGVGVVGVLDEPPHSLAAAFGHPGYSVIDVLAASPGRWRPYLAFLLARYGDEVSAWQVGGDKPQLGTERASLSAALANVRETLRPLVGSPQIAVSHDIRIEPADPGLGADVASLFVPAEIGSSRLSTQIAGFVRKDAPANWAMLEALPAHPLEPRVHLAETARRMVEARSAGIDTVFVPQPWCAPDGGGPVVPDRAFVALRLLGNALSGLAPMGDVAFAPGVTARLFGEPAGRSGVLVVWTEGDGPNPARVVCDALLEAAHYDIRGRMRPTASTPRGRVFTVDAAPSVIMPVDTKRIQTVSSFQVEPVDVKVQVEPNRRRLRLRNFFGAAMTGDLVLMPPEGWRVSPERHQISLGPGAWAEIELSIQLPANQAVGDFALEARFTREGDSTPELTLRAPVRVTSPGLDVGVLTRVDGTRLHIVQRITNRTDRALDLRAMVLFPDRRSETRMVRRLAAGATTVREYVIDHADRLVGRPIRVTAEEPEGGLRCHRIVTIEAPE